MGWLPSRTRPHVEEARALLESYGFPEHEIEGELSHMAEEEGRLPKGTNAKCLDALVSDPSMFSRTLPRMAETPALRRRLPDVVSLLLRRDDTAARVFWYMPLWTRDLSRTQISSAFSGLDLARPEIRHLCAFYADALDASIGQAQANAVWEEVFGKGHWIKQLAFLAPSRWPSRLKSGARALLSGDTDISLSGVLAVRKIDGSPEYCCDANTYYENILDPSHHTHGKGTVIRYGGKAAGMMKFVAGSYQSFLGLRNILDKQGRHVIAKGGIYAANKDLRNAAHAAYLGASRRWGVLDLPSHDISSLRAMPLRFLHNTRVENGNVVLRTFEQTLAEIQKHSAALSQICARYDR